MSCVVAVSGGLDSTVLLAKAINEFKKSEVVPVHFIYPSWHNALETQAVTDVCNHYGMLFLNVDLRPSFQFVKSALLNDGEHPKIPEGHYEDDSMRQTIVPGRNLMFISVMVAVAQSFECKEVWFGAHKGDATIYPDCRSDFITVLHRAIRLATENEVKLEAPFLDLDKAQVVKEGIHLEIPFALTRTCYTNYGTACGKCGACQERLEAFEQNASFDPIPYMSRELIAKV